MKIFKYFINIILSFFIVIMVLAIIALNILNSVILNKEYMLSKMEETEFNLQISREVQNGFENYRKWIFRYRNNRYNKRFIYRRNDSKRCKNYS